MGVGKKKKERKTIHFYQMAFQLEPPYHVLFEPAYLREALHAKVDTRDQLEKMINAKVIPSMF
jgi:hypothetical protein